MEDLKGPIAILGSTGFVGGNLYKKIKAYRDDVIAPTRDELFGDVVNAKTVFNCIGYGSHEKNPDPQKMYEANFLLVRRLLSIYNFEKFINVGSTTENHLTSEYGVSKEACASLIYYYGQTLGRGVSNIRFPHIFGPGEPEHHLIPRIIKDKYIETEDRDKGLELIFIDDVCSILIEHAINLKPDDYGFSLDFSNAPLISVGKLVDIVRTEMAAALKKTLTSSDIM